MQVSACENVVSIGVGIVLSELLSQSQATATLRKLSSKKSAARLKTFAVGVEKMDLMLVFFALPFFITN
jgi:hypothetical protein